MAALNLLGPRARRLYEALIESPSLVGLWPLNEQSGNVVDHGPNRLAGTVSGNPTYSTAIAGHFSGLNLDGSGDYASLGDASSLSFERTDSFSFLCLLDPNVSALGEILSKWDGAGAGWAWGVNATRTWRLLLQNTATTNVLEVRSTNALTNGTDILLGMSYAGGSAPGDIVMYENGATVTMTTVSNNLAASIDNAVAAVIGAQSDGTDALNGHLAFVAAWNRALSAEEFRRFAFLAGML